jgi:DNA-binding NtrC family response regulator
MEASEPISKRILVIEDDQNLATLLRLNLKRLGFEADICNDGEKGLEAAKSVKYDILICDVRLPNFSGLSITEALHHAKPLLPIIVISGYDTAENAIEATRNGAFDFLMKPFEMSDLEQILDKAVKASELQNNRVRVSDRGGALQNSLVGRSRAMQEVFKQIGLLANKPVSVLILGETGTGKEMVAKALVNYSNRADKPFIPVNCAAIPETLLESELFGHEKGSFTGAQATRIGRFEQAKEGTLLLDEIGDLPVQIQVKLLRVLQEKVFQRVGGTAWISSDARVIASTSRDLVSEIKAGRFREDLYYRLGEAIIHLPPLRERDNDLDEIIEHFLQEFGPQLGVSNPVILPDGLKYLQSLRWPGNVRELRNLIRQALIASKGFPISLELVKQLQAQTEAWDDPAKGTHLTEWVRGSVEAACEGKVDNVIDRLRGAVEREAYQCAMELAEGNQSRAAQWLGVSLPTMRERLIHFGLHPRLKSRG